MKKTHHPILLATAVVGALAAGVSAFVDWRRRHAPPVVVVTLPGVAVKGEERDRELVERPAPAAEPQRMQRRIGEP